MKRSPGAGVLPLSLLILMSAPAWLGQTGAAPEEGRKGLAFSGQVSGTVLSPERQPVEGTSVAVVNEEATEVFGSSTDGNGRYAVRGLPSGSYAVLVMDPGGNVLRKDGVSVRPLFRNLVDFITEPAGSPSAHRHPEPPRADAGETETLGVSGILVDAGGVPIPEAWVMLTPAAGSAPAVHARTDVEGRFRLLRVAAGHYRLHARALGHVTWRLGPLLLAAERDLTLRLTMLAFPLGHPESLENLLVPVDPVPPEKFEEERASEAPAPPVKAGS